MSCQGEGGPSRLRQFVGKPVRVRFGAHEPWLVYYCQALPEPASACCLLVCDYDELGTPGPARELWVAPAPHLPLGAEVVVISLGE